MKNNDIVGQRKILFFDTECVPENNNGNLMIFNDKSKNNPPKPKYFEQITWMVYSEKGEFLYYNDYIYNEHNDSYLLGYINMDDNPKRKNPSPNIFTLCELLNHFISDVKNCDIIVAHNLKFDKGKITKALLLECKVKFNPYDKIEFCTMEDISVLNYCKENYKYINHCKEKYKNNEFDCNNIPVKWPKLIELHTLLFHEGLKDDHDALYHSEACAKCFFELKNKGLIII